jgi:small subunit ribosomal protein S1
MSDPHIPTPPATEEQNESFGSILSQFEQGHTAQRTEGAREGTVVSVSADSVFIDIGFKSEGVLPLSELQNPELPNNDKAVKPGDKLQVTIKGRAPRASSS